MSEPTITINGRELSQAEAMTVRVAIGAFASSIEAPGSLGDDEHGRVMRDGYLRACERCLALMRGK